MEYLVTAEEMKAYDHATIETFGVPSLVLMERAALACAQVIMERDERLRRQIKQTEDQKLSVGRRTLILAGCGNNGGDGLAIGRILAQAGFPVDFVLLAREKEGAPTAFSRQRCSEQTAVQLDILEKYGYQVRHELPEGAYDIIVDALFGIGLNAEVTGNLARAVEWVNEQDAFVLSVDVPSGINADTGAVCGCAVRADVTVTFAFRKLGLVLPCGAEHAGEVVTAQIGITPESFLGRTPSVFTYTEDVRKLLPGRRSDGNKGTFGKVLLAAGSRGMAGAAVLAGRAVLHAGAGMVRILTEEANRVILQTALPEAMLSIYDLSKERTVPERVGTQEPFAEQALAPMVLREAVGWADVEAVGPGLGMGESARAIVRSLLLDSDKPLVVDADAINILADDDAMLEALVRRQEREETRRALIFTPHPGELARLEGCRIQEAVKQAFCITEKWAKRLHAVFLCKGARTAVSAPDGRKYLNQSGNSGMATAGSGDVLTGILAALLAQGMPVFEAACAGVYLHGLAGDAAARRKNPYSLTAGSLIDGLDEVL